MGCGKGKKNEWDFGNNPWYLGNIGLASSFSPKSQEKNP